MKKIPLTQGKFALVDNEDFLLVSKYKWYYRKSGRTNGENGYAETTLYRNGKRKTLFMHNLILPPKKKLIVDHRNRNGLNNKRINLRLVTKWQNYHNYPKKGKNLYRGVQLKKALKLNPWEVTLKFKKKIVFNKTFSTAKEGARAYNEQALKYYGDSAQLNKI